MKNQLILKLPFKGKLICLQGNKSKRSHKKEYPNTKYSIDFSLKTNRSFPLLASARGKAKIWRCCNHKSGNCKCGLGFGNQIRVYHGKYFIFYSHLSKILVRDGQHVKQGSVIGIAGKTGLAGNIHLHWTLGIESKKIMKVKGRFIPFWSIKANKIEIIEKGKKKIVSSTYFKEGKTYQSTIK